MKTETTTLATVGEDGIGSPVQERRQGPEKDRVPMDDSSRPRKSSAEPAIPESTSTRRSWTESVSSGAVSHTRCVPRNG